MEEVYSGRDWLSRGKWVDQNEDRRSRREDGQESEQQILLSGGSRFFGPNLFPSLPKLLPIARWNFLALCVETIRRL